MLIPSGWAKGLKLKTPKGESTRPTSARVRGAILNMLAPELADALFLDLFAGSGAMGIEAVSRGARGAVFVEQGREALQCLRDNLAELKRRSAAQNLEAPTLTVVGRDVAKALDELQSLSPFDVMFADPPYKDARGWIDVLLGPLGAMAAPEGVLVVETAATDGTALASPGFGWSLVKQRAYGDTMVSMLSREDPERGGSRGEGEEGES